LTKEKKDKEKVLIDLELIILKKYYMFNFEKIEEDIKRIKKEVGRGK
jgi:hypothetical protein